MLFTRIILSLLAVVAGVLMVKYNFQLVNSVARLEWFERNLGAGSTYLIYKLLGVGLIFAGILYLTGFGGTVLNWLLSPLKQLFPH